MTFIFIEVWLMYNMMSVSGVQDSDSIFLQIILHFGLPWWLSGKESTCNAGDLGLDPWVGKIPWRNAWQPTPVLLPGESHGPRSLEGQWSIRSQRIAHDWRDWAHVPTHSILNYYYHGFSWLKTTGCCIDIWEIVFIYSILLLIRNNNNMIFQPLWSYIWLLDTAA